jgi:hypothetical protein
MNEVIYQLKTPFKYALKGEQVEASFITLIAPTYKSVANFAPIKQAFTSAISELSHGTLSEATNESSSDEAAGEIDLKSVMHVLYNWSGDTSKVFLHAEALFKNGSALVEGETKFTSPMLEKMDFHDVEGLLGTYVANFIAKSLMDGLD